MKVQAAKAVFKFIQPGVVETEQRSQLRAVTEQLHALEAGERIGDTQDRVGHRHGTLAELWR